MVVEVVVSVGGGWVPELGSVASADAPHADNVSTAAQAAPMRARDRGEGLCSLMPSGYPAGT